MQILHTDLMEKSLSFIDLKFPYSEEFYWYWQIFSKLWQNGSKYCTLNILNINFKDSVLIVLMAYYLYTCHSQIWIEVEKEGQETQLQK